MNRVYIGTSGYIHPHWNQYFHGDIHDKNIKNAKNELSNYAQNFNFVEINYSFYQLFVAFNNTDDNPPSAIKNEHYLTKIIS
jgi:uncharacterized protein YecE (DUF72 family)